MEGKQEVIGRLRQDLLAMQGYKPSQAAKIERIGMGELEEAFPSGAFPRRAIHEFVCHSVEEIAATDGFIGGLLSALMIDGKACVWVSTQRRLFPASLAAFGVEADRIIFIDVSSEREALWVMEEALACEGLAAVVAEVDALSLIDSRRLQLAVEKNGIPGFVIRKDIRRMASTVSTARWRISPIPSADESALPGLGFPRWQVELLKVRSGKPGIFFLEWAGDIFSQLAKPESAQPIYLPFENIG
ncbi:Error-prone repair protein ImuA [Pedobacter aquatilis]|uniref:ImuA family protein n=1 Tax=Pedobacter aquatilis TaxID=351343 RepID=UPI00292DEE53|nr:Error-prone repair protein ImuA [Pedobacter aquatilis]